MKKKKAIAIEIICFLFILLFTYAAVTKLMDYQKFTVQIGQSPMLTNYAGLLAWLVPISELVIAGMLAITRLRLAGLYAAFAVMVMFTAYIVAILQFSEKVPCSCGGVLEAMGWTEHLIFNIGFAILGFAGVILNISKVEDKKSVNTSVNRYRVGEKPVVRQQIKI